MDSVVPEGLYAVTVHFGSSEEIGVKASTVFMNGIIEKASKIRVKSGVFIHNVHSNDPTKYRKTAFLGGLIDVSTIRHRMMFRMSFLNLNCGKLPMTHSIRYLINSNQLRY